jgi:hypothetical protein
MTDNDAAITIAAITSICALIGVIFTSILSALVLYKTRQTHELVNGQMAEFRRTLQGREEARIGQAMSTGILQGEQAQRDRANTGSQP